jgi:hypothetical protein
MTHDLFILNVYYVCVYLLRVVLGMHTMVYSSDIVQLQFTFFHVVYRGATVILIDTYNAIVFLSVMAIHS